MEKSRSLLPDIHRYYKHRLMVYVKLMAMVPFYDDYQKREYQVIIDWYTEAIARYKRDEFFAMRFNFTWHNWRLRNPVDETWAQWISCHNIVPDLVESDSSILTQPEL